MCRKTIIKKITWICVRFEYVFFFLFIFVYVCGFVYICLFYCNSCMRVCDCVYVFRTRVRMCAILQGGENPVIHSHHILLDMDCGHAMLGKCS